MTDVVLLVILIASFRLWVHMRRKGRPLPRSSYGRLRDRQAARHRGARDAASRARGVTAIYAAFGAGNAACAGIAAATGRFLAAVIFCAAAAALSGAAAWPLRRRYAWLLENPGLAWCLLAGRYHRAQLRIVLAARRAARTLPDHSAAAEVPSLRAAQCWTSAPAAPRPAPGDSPLSLREYRCQLGLAAAWLDTAVGLPRGAVSKIESGQRRVSVKTARALEVALQRGKAAAAAVYVDGHWQQREVPGSARYAAHYHATSGGWLHFDTVSGTDLWFGRSGGACRCDACAGGEG